MLEGTPSPTNQSLTLILAVLVSLNLALLSLQLCSFRVLDEVPYFLRQLSQLLRKLSYQKSYELTQVGILGAAISL